MGTVLAAALRSAVDASHHVTAAAFYVAHARDRAMAVDRKVSRGLSPQPWSAGALSASRSSMMT